ncbi:MAG: SPOR domain-containing protein [Methylotenera sp.]|nr:sporulation protein [Methylotenera sp.]
MPPELPNDQELNLKKRARRRLVGAIALVLLMVIILPMMLQDRAALAPKDAIKITMPEPAEVVVEANATQQALTAVVEAPVTPTIADETKMPEIKAEAKETVEKKGVTTVDLMPAEPKPAEAKFVEKKPVEPKRVEPKPVEDKLPSKSSGSFTIQVGVYSDPANVKQLQAKLKDAGFASHTENITTPKGEKIRLRAGKYASRQDAADALDKLKASGLPGMVISND